MPVTSKNEKSVSDRDLRAQRRHAVRRGVTTRSSSLCRQQSQRDSSNEVTAPTQIRTRRAAAVQEGFSSTMAVADPAHGVAAVTSNKRSISNRGKKRATTSSFKGTSSKKKIRTSSSKRQPASLPTVTPGSHPRRLRFDPTFGTPEDDHNHSLPDGVVDIFGSKPFCMARCTCPSAICLERGTAVAFAHITQYGHEFSKRMKDKEKAETIERLKLLPMDQPSSYHDASGRGIITVLRRDKRTTSRQPKLHPRTLDMHDGASELLESSVPLPRQPSITPRMRSILVNWMVEVGQEYKVSDEAFHLSIALLDEVLTRGPTPSQLVEYKVEDSDDDEEFPFFLVSRSDFQAVGCACIWIASKIEDKDHLSQQNLVYISDESFSTAKLRLIEKKICDLLGFHLNRATPVNFLSTFLRASNACGGSCMCEHPVLRNMVLYLIELGRYAYTLSMTSPSLLTASAIYLARATIGIREANKDRWAIGDSRGYWTRTLEHYTGYTFEDIIYIVTILHRYHEAATAEGASSRASFTKFRRALYRNVSLKTVVREEDLGIQGIDNEDEGKVEEEDVEPYDDEEEGSSEDGGDHDDESGDEDNETENRATTTAMVAI